MIVHIICRFKRFSNFLNCLRPCDPSVRNSENLKVRKLKTLCITLEKISGWSSRRRLLKETLQSIERKASEKKLESFISFLSFETEVKKYFKFQSFFLELKKMILDRESTMNIQALENLFVSQLLSIFVLLSFWTNGERAPLQNLSATSQSTSTNVEKQPKHLFLHNFSPFSQGCIAYTHWLRRLIGWVVGRKLT